VDCPAEYLDGSGKIAPCELKLPHHEERALILGILRQRSPGKRLRSVKVPPAQVGRGKAGNHGSTLRIQLKGSFENVDPLARSAGVNQGGAEAQSSGSFIDRALSVHEPAKSKSKLRYGGSQIADR
jgi:hypothetical protein